MVNRAKDPRESDSDSESDAPETVHLSSSKRDARKKQGEMDEWRRGQKYKRKARALAIQQNGKGKEKEIVGATNDDEDERLRERMNRAMMEAGAEEEGASDGGDFGEEMDAEDSKDGMESEGEGDTEEEDELETDEDEENEADDPMVTSDLESDADGDGRLRDDDSGDGETDSEEEEDEDLSVSSPPPTSKYLPDHLFSSLASRSAQSAASNSNTKNASATSKSKSKRKKSSAKPKDRVIGTRTVRILSTSSSTVEAGSLQKSNPKIKKFLKNAMKGGSGKQWERRSVNVGLMKRIVGPAARFVRGT